MTQLDHRSKNKRKSKANTARTIINSVIRLEKRVWKVAAHEDDAPKATDARRSWREVLAAATVQGAVFGGVKAAIDRAGATGFAKATGTWPGPKKR